MNVDVEVKRQLWTPKANGHSHLDPIWVLEVHRETGEFVTFRCENAVTCATYNLAPAALTGFYEPTDQFEIVA